MLSLRWAVSELNLDTGILCHFLQGRFSVFSILTSPSISDVSRVPGTHWTAATMTSTTGSHHTPHPKTSSALTWSGNSRLSLLDTPRRCGFLHWPVQHNFSQ